MARDEACLLDILRAARRIQQVTANKDQLAFANDQDAQEIVLWQFAVIGEAVQHRLSKSFCAIHNAVPWDGIVGMRNRLVHGYDQVDLEEVWKTIIEDVPQLVRYLEPLIPPEDEV